MVLVILLIHWGKWVKSNRNWETVKGSPSWNAATETGGWFTVFKSSSPCHKHSVSWKKVKSLLCKKKKKNVSEGNKCSETWLGWNFPCIYTFEISVLKLSTYAWGGRGNNQMLENMPSSVPLFEGVKMLFSSHSPCYFGCQVVSLPRFHIKNNCGDFFFPAHAGGGIPVVPFFLQKANMRYSPVLI